MGPAATTSALPHALWPLLTLAVVLLWVAALVQIAGHGRAGSHTRTGLLCIAAAVSVAAILTIAGIGAVFAGQRHEVAGKTAETSSAQGGQREGAQGRAFVFSFGLEHVSHLNPDGPAKDGNATGTR